MELAIKAVGDNGKVQKIITFVTVASASLTLVLSVSFAYLTKRPEFLCRQHNALNPDFQPCEYTDNLCSSKFEIEKDPSRSVDNFAYSFDLYCSKSFYVPMLSTLFFFGGILGCVLLSAVPDKFGRQKIFKILMILSCILHINLLFTFGPLHLVVVHFLCGIASFAYGMSSVIVSEYSPRNIAGIVMSITNAVYPLTGIAVGLYFMFVNNWRLLFLITTVIHIVVTYLVLKYFVESPRWLNSQKKTEECLATLRIIAEINGRVKEWEDFQNNNQHLLQGDKGKGGNTEVSKTFSIFQIITFKSQRKNFILNTFVWFAAGFCFYGIILNLGHMGGDFFADSILAFTGEISSELSSGWLAEIFGRVLVMQVGAFLGATAFLLYISISSSFLWLKSILIFLSTFGFAAIFNVVFIYTPELFPTPIRGTICGFSYLISRLGAMIVSPITEAFGPSHANLIFVLFGYAMGTACFYLEETLGKEMQDEIPEALGATSFVASGTYLSSDNMKYDVISDGIEKSQSYSKYFNK